MAELNFPSNPQPGDQYTIGSRTWFWNGRGWQIVSSVTSFDPLTVSRAIITTSTNSTSTTTGGLIVYGGVGVGGNLYATALYDSDSRVITTSSIVESLSTLAVTRLYAGTDTAVSTSVGIVSVWNTSTLQSITSRGSSTDQIIILTNTTRSTASNSGALVVTGGIGAGNVFAGDLNVANTATLSGPISLISGAGTSGNFLISNGNNVGTDWSANLRWNGEFLNNNGFDYWTTGSGWAGFKVGHAMFYGDVSNHVNGLGLASNGDYDPGYEDWIYLENGYITLYNTDPVAGKHSWYTSPLGAQGSYIYQNGTGQFEIQMYLEDAKLYVTSDIYSNGYKVVTEGSISSLGLTALYAGTDTAVSANVGSVTVWNTSTLQSITNRGSSTTQIIRLTNTTQSTGTTTGALIVTGGIGVGGNIYATSVNSNAIFDSGNRVVTSVVPTQGPAIGISSLVSTGTATSFVITNLGVHSLTGTSDITVSASTGSITVSNTSTLQTVTSRGNTTDRTINITNATEATNTTTAALTVKGGIGANTAYIGALSVDKVSRFFGPTTFADTVTFNGTATFVYSTNTYYTDNLIELHTPPNGVGSLWTQDDGKDIGFRLHYYNGSIGTNAALILANDTKYLEWYQSGAESTTGTFTATTYGTFKTGSIKLVDTTSATNTYSGALTVIGGVGVGGSLYASELYDAGNRVISSASLDSYGVSTISAGTDTAVSTSRGTVVIWNTSNLQSITSRGSSTNQIISITNTTKSTGTTTGALIVSGGIGAGNIYTQVMTVTNTVLATSTSSGALVVAGGVGVGGNLYANAVYDGNNRVVTSVVPTQGPAIGISSLVSTGTATSFVITNLGVHQIVSGLDISVSASTGTVIVTATSTLQSVTSKGSSTNQIIRLTNTTSSTSTTTGALVVSGGIGAENVYTNNLNVVNTATFNGPISLASDVGSTNTFLISKGNNATPSWTAGLEWNGAFITAHTSDDLWGGEGIYGGLQFGNSVLYSNIATKNVGLGLASGGQYDNFSWYYQQNGYITLYNTDNQNGLHNWYMSPYGFKGAPLIDWTPQMQLDANSDLYVSGLVYVNGGDPVVTEGSLGTLGVTSLYAGTDTAVDANVGSIVVWNTSTLQSITNRSPTTTNIISLTNTTKSTSTNTGALIVSGGIGAGNIYTQVMTVTNTALATSTASGALVVAGGIGASNIWVDSIQINNSSTFFGNNTFAGTNTFTGPVTFKNLVTFSGSATYVYSTNTAYTDNLIELHSPPGGIGSLWEQNDGKDIGFRFHYYANSTDTNAALILSADTRYLEWYNKGADGNTSTFTSATYGTFKTGSIILTSNSSATNTYSGALVVNGGIGVGGSLYASELYDAGNRVLTSANLGNFGVTSLSAGTDTALSTSVGIVSIWSTATLQSITNRGGTTTNAISITNTTDASSTTTGALTVSGGIGILGKAYIGGPLAVGAKSNLGNLSGSKVLTIYSANSSTDYNGSVLELQGAGNGATGIQGAIKFWSAYSTTPGLNILTSEIRVTNASDGNNTGSQMLFYTKNITTSSAAQAMKIDQNQIITVLSTTSSTSTTTGALLINGGVGVGGSLYASALYDSGARVLTTSTAPQSVVSAISAGTDTAVTTSTGGLIIWNTSTLQSVTSRGSSTNQIITITNTTSATSTTTGALVVAGGVGIGGNIHAYGNVIVGGSTSSNWNADYRVLQLGKTAIFAGQTTTNILELGQLWYRNAGGNYIATLDGNPTSYRQTSGQHLWYNNTSSVTAGDTLSNWNPAMSLSTAGYLTVGSTASIAKLTVDVDNNGWGFGQNHKGIQFGIRTIVDGTQIGVHLGTISNNDLYLITNGTVKGKISTDGTLIWSNSIYAADMYSNNFRVLTEETLGTVGVTRVDVGTDTAISTTTGAVLIWNTSTLQSITSRGSSTTQIISITNTTKSTGTTTGALIVSGGIGAGNIYTQVMTVTNTTAATSTSSGALVVAGGIGVNGGIYVGGTSKFVGQTVFDSLVTFNGTATFVYSTNTYYTDNLIELHTPPNGVGGLWGVSDGKDIGVRFHYYNGTTGTSGALILANDTKYLEWYQSGTESTTGTFTATAVYGTFKTGSIVISDTTASSDIYTGALRVTGGVGIQGKLYASEIYDSGSRVLTTANLANNGVVTINAGTDTAVTNVSGISTIWNTSTLQSVTSRGSSTNQIINITNTTSSTSTTTGALVVAGGIGVAGSMVIGGASSSSTVRISGGGSFNVLGYPTLMDIVQDSQNTWGLTLRNSKASADTGIGMFLNDSGDFYIEQGSSTYILFKYTTSTGQTIISSGGGAALTNQSVSIQTWSRSWNFSQDSTLQFPDGTKQYTAYTSTIATSFKITNTTQATSTTTGALVVAGGVGIGGSTVIGAEAIARTSAKNVYASGRFTTAGDAQSETYILRAYTSNATQTPLTSDGAASGSTNQIVMPNNSVYTFRASVTAKSTSTSNEGGWEFNGVVARGATAITTAVKMTNKTKIWASSSTWDVNVVADTTNGAIKFLCQGDTSNIRWVARVDTVEVTDP